MKVEAFCQHYKRVSTSLCEQGVTEAAGLLSGIRETIFIRVGVDRPNDEEIRGLSNPMSTRIMAENGAEQTLAFHEFAKSQIMWMLSKGL